MASRRVYKPVRVELPFEEGILPFKIFKDGTVYWIQETKKPARTMQELLLAIAQSGEKEKGPYVVTKETLRKVRNTTLEKLVFKKYLEDLEVRKRQEENEKVDSEETDE